PGSVADFTCDHRAVVVPLRAPALDSAGVRQCARETVAGAHDGNAGRQTRNVSGARSVTDPRSVAEAAAIVRAPALYAAARGHRARVVVPCSNRSRGGEPRDRNRRPSICRCSVSELAVVVPAPTPGGVVCLYGARMMLPSRKRNNAGGES